MAQVLLALITLIMISLFFLLPEHWYLWLAITFGIFALLAAWHAKRFSYLCPGCGEVFKVSRFDDLISPNGVNKKYLRCPRCGRRTWADILRTKE
jgi:Bacteriophage tail assembly protein